MYLFAMSCGVLFVARAVVLVCGLALGWVAVVARVQAHDAPRVEARVPLGLYQRGRLGLGYIATGRGVVYRRGWGCRSGAIIDDLRRFNIIIGYIYQNRGCSRLRGDLGASRAFHVFWGAAGGFGCRSGCHWRPRRVLGCWATAARLWGAFWAFAGVDGAGAGVPVAVLGSGRAVLGWVAVPISATENRTRARRSVLGWGSGGAPVGLG